MNTTRYSLTQTQQDWLCANADSHQVLTDIAVDFGEQGWITRDQWMALKVSYLTRVAAHNAKKSA